MDEPTRRQKRLQLAYSGLQYLVGGIGIGVTVLAIIGWLFPHWEVSRPLFLVCSAISISVMIATVAGAWMLIKAALNMVE